MSDNLTMVEKALHFAVLAHRGQKDKGGLPFILHPVRVLIDLQRKCALQVVQAAAVLHDVVEDTECTIEEIYADFGPVVGILVKYMTRIPEEETHAEYIERLADNTFAVQIKLADLRDNMDPERATTEFGLQKRYAKSYYRLRFLGRGSS